MYPGTIVNWYDQSTIDTTTTETVDNRPIFMAVSSFDRGPEDIRCVYGQTFFDLYGSTMSFSKHGQPALQCKNIINAGGELLIKRLVASNALLANVVFTATVTAVITATKSTVDAATSLQYIISGVEDKAATDKYVVSSTATVVKWAAVSITGCKSSADVVTAATALNVTATPTSVTKDSGETYTITKSTVYPMFTVSENGRGVSSKAVKFVADLSQSKDMANMFYNVYIYDGTTKLESAVATLNPTATYNSKLYGMNGETSVQVIFQTIGGMFAKYLVALETATGLSEAALLKCDLIFMTDNKGSAITGVTLDRESTDLGATYGVELQNGDNGAFGDKPFGTSEWETAAVKVFDGTYDDVVWDTDTYKIAAVFDANYPTAVKEAIATFVNFREDCMFFRDYNIDCDSYASIIAKCAAINDDYKTRYIADYFTTYQIYDPETMSRIRVTMMYDFAADCVSHFSNGAYRPLAGVVNSMTLDNAIEGTLNFTPRITPAVNQKSLFDDKRINYAIFNNGQCVVQSLYTSQPDYTQLSYANNVLAIQEVIRAVRTACPKVRYTFTSGSDFTTYSDAVNTVLKGFTSNFANLTFSYKQNSLKAAQKIFYATISFRFSNWAQTEVFDIYALGDDES